MVGNKRQSQRGHASLLSGRLLTEWKYAPISHKITTTCLLLRNLPSQQVRAKITPTLSDIDSPGTKILTADPRSAGSCEVGPPWIRLYCLSDAQSTPAWTFFLAIWSPVAVGLDHTGQCSLSKHFNQPWLPMTQFQFHWFSFTPHKSCSFGKKTPTQPFSRYSKVLVKAHLTSKASTSRTKCWTYPTHCQV